MFLSTGIHGSEVPTAPSRGTQIDCISYYLIMKNYDMSLCMAVEKREVILSNDSILFSRCMKKNEYTYVSVFYHKGQ